jgi:lipoprotein-anchoring transpeptidase ErfK/SrfK
MGYQENRVLGPSMFEGTGARSSERSDTRLREITPSIEKLESMFGLESGHYALVINPQRQELYLIRNRAIEKIYKVSTAKDGLGTKAESNRTPIGTHIINKKIGNDAPFGTVFKDRIPTGEVVTHGELAQGTVEGKMLTRILWLSGMEDGINKGGDVDSYVRKIYIHGTASERNIGSPASMGCIRMSYTDVIELSNLVREGTLVEIENKDYGQNVSKK